MADRAASGAFLAVLLAGLVLAADRPAAAPAALPDSYPTATEVRLGGDDADTRFVMDLSRKIDLHAFTLADPYRVVIDIPEVVFRLPPKVGEGGRGLIRAFRFGLMMEGGSRIVIDVAKPVRVAKAFVIDAAAGDPARLVLDLVPTDRATFMRNMAAEDRLLTSSTTAPDQQAVNRSDPRPLIVLDPGHGGIDTGARAPTGQVEKDIVLDFAKRLAARLEKSGRYRVLMTRSDDTYVPLDERVRIARKANASLFVSIHADSLPRNEGDAQGATVYTLSNKASDAQAAALADTENRADVIAGVDLKTEPNDVADILIDLAQRETKTFSLQFAHDVVSDLRGTARLHKEPIKSAGFRVLRAPDVPSVLVELGYVSDRDDLKSLMSDTWRNHTADSIAKAIDSYFSTHVAATPNGGK
ncbi:MAG TPA: N-acetylmuramoyl-L-alanine amidase [Xanthobacteraceae bacterium]|nr:N-acetylmuramoyl-L-alanine amidase [Xanthobacteraceae bacterium]